MIWVKEKEDITYREFICQISHYIDIFGDQYKLREFDHCTENPTCIVRRETIYDDGCQYIHEDRATRMQIYTLKVLLTFVSTAFNKPLITFSLSENQETIFKQIRITKLDLPNYYIYGIINDKNVTIEIDNDGKFKSENLDEVYIDELNRRRSDYESSFK